MKCNKKKLPKYVCLGYNCKNFNVMIGIQKKVLTNLQNLPYMSTEVPLCSILPERICFLP